MTIGRRVIAVMMIVAGAGMLAAPAGRYSSGTYEVLFDVLPRGAWGAALLFAGVAGLFPGRFGLVTMALVSSTWSVGLWAAVLTGSAETWGGPAWPTCIAILLVIYAGAPTPGGR